MANVGTVEVEVKLDTAGMEAMLTQKLKEMKAQASRVPSLEKNLAEVQQLLWDQIRKMKGSEDPQVAAHSAKLLKRETKDALVERILEQRNIVAHSQREAVRSQNLIAVAYRERDAALAELDSKKKLEEELRADLEKLATSISGELASAKSLAESESNRARTARRAVLDAEKRLKDAQLWKLRYQQRLDALLFSHATVVAQLRKYQENDPQFLAQHGIEEPSRNELFMKHDVEEGWCEDDELKLAQ